MPAEPGRVAPGERVLVHLTRQGLAGLPEQIPVPTDNALRGTLIRASGEQIVVRVPLGVDRQGLRSEVFGQDVTVPVGSVDDFWLRRFSPVRTALVAAGGAAVAGTLFFTFGSIANEAGPGTPPEETVRIPLFSVSIP